MKYLFTLSGPNYNLAKEEIKALAPVNFIFFKNFLIIDTNHKKINFLSKRLALTHEIYKIQSNGKKTFKTRKNSKNFLCPKNSKGIFMIKKKTYKAKLIKKIPKDFLKRKPHLRPQLHPSSLNPKLAKCLINLTGIKKGSILDPFCGSGGILIEAAFMNLKPIGYDINEIMLRRAIINLTHYKIKNFELKLKDSTKLRKKFNYIVTDLPYGRNTAVKDLNKLYSNFLKTLKKILLKKSVICFPDFINYKSLIRKSNLKIEKEFSYYLHKNLIKKIVILK